MAEIPNPFDSPARQLSMQEKIRLLNNIGKGTPGATQYHLRVNAAELDQPVSGESVMKMGQYFNPELTQASDYFKSLDAMMKCVENNVQVTDPAEQNRVCAKEYKDLRVAAFQNKLFYSEVNKRWFMRELQYNKNFSNF